MGRFTPDTWISLGMRSTGEPGPPTSRDAGSHGSLLSASLLPARWASPRGQSGARPPAATGRTIPRAKGPRGVPRGRFRVGAFPGWPPAPSGVAGQGKSVDAWQGRGRVTRGHSAERRGRHASDAGPELQRPQTAPHARPAPRSPGCRLPPRSGDAGLLRCACLSPHRTPWLSELPCPKRSFLVAVKCVFPVQSLKILSPHPLRCSAPPRVRGAPRVVWAASFCTMARGVTCSARVTPVCAVPLSGRFKQYFQDTHGDTPSL